MADRYNKDDKMYELICMDCRSLQIISRFNISLGVKDKTIEEVCKEQNVDCDTFLTVVNFTKYGINKYDPIPKLSIKSLTNYLKQAHSYYLDFLLPSIRKKLIEAINYSSKNDVALLILKFFDEYIDEIRKHMQRENDEIFPYVDTLLLGKVIDPISITMSSLHQSSIENKLSELKNIIIKYYADTYNSNLLNTVLYDIFLCEDDLINHCKLEEFVFIPALARLEQKNKDKQDNAFEEDDDETESLTDREKDVIVCVVKGFSNKEIADKLCISFNTVTTHRRNIARKLDIHSPSSLTIYALVNNLVNIDDIKL
jgi:DNA-binding CsgD family transcriptional regulator